MPIIATDPELPAYERPRYSTRTPEVVTPSPVVSPKADALTLFREDPAALKSSALALLDIKIIAPKTPEDASALSDKIASAAVIVKNVEARRVTCVQAIKREAAAVDAEAKTWSGPVEKWIGDAKRALLAYQRKAIEDAQRAEEARQQAIRDAAKKKGEAEIMGNAEAREAAAVAIMDLEAAPAVAPLKGFKTEAGSNTIRKRWTVQVINAHEVPDAYMVPDLAKLQAAVDASPDPSVLRIDGCHIEEVESLVTRTR